MSNEVTKEMLDESLASIQYYLDNTSAEDILNVMEVVGGLTGGDISAAEVIGYVADSLPVGFIEDESDTSLIPQEVFDRVKVIKEKARVAREGGDIMNKFEDLIKQVDFDNNKFIILKGTHEERKLKLIEDLVPFDKDRLRAAIGSKVNVVPEGLSREETRKLILSRSSKDDTNE